MKHFIIKARSVRYATSRKMREAIEKNMHIGMWQPTDDSDSAAPLVPIVKSDDSVRLNGEYKVTVNHICRMNPYPPPRIEDIFAELKRRSKMGTNRFPFCIVPNSC